MECIGLRNINSRQESTGTIRRPDKTKTNTKQTIPRACRLLLSGADVVTDDVRKNWREQRDETQFIRKTNLEED
jgi:hypothetical protein